jgi:hypothetical protein
MELIDKLKKAPKGFEMYSPMFGDVYLLEVMDVPGIERYIATDKCNFTEEGKYNSNGEVMLFPSADNRDWNTIDFTKQFKPFQKVVVKEDGVWTADVYSHYDDRYKLYICIGGAFEEVLPYNDDTKDLVGTRYK